MRGIGDTLVLGKFLSDVAKLDQPRRNFRVFGPDETLSNGLESLFEVTERQWDAATVPNDELLAPAGRVMEMLSEHQCEGWLEGQPLMRHIWTPPRSQRMLGDEAVVNGDGGVEAGEGVELFLKLPVYRSAFPCFTNSCGAPRSRQQYLEWRGDRCTLD